MTEQGEVLAARYDNSDIAFRHLEQITAATFLVEGEVGQEPETEWVEIVRLLGDRAYRVYRDLVEMDGFVDYFRAATPIEVIEDLPIGSRPSRRRSCQRRTDRRTYRRCSLGMRQTRTLYTRRRH